MATFHRPLILLIDPDREAAARLGNLLAVRYAVETVRSAAEARGWLAEAERDPELIVVELELPDSDGLVMVAELRSRTTSALLVHTAKDGQREMILSFRLGADDFVPKPGDEAEIEARVGALLRRMRRSAAAGSAGGPGGGGSGGGGGAGGGPSGPSGPSGGRGGAVGGGEVQRIGDLVVDRERAMATIGGRLLYLTQTEFRLLSVFARRIEEPLRRDELARMAGDESYVEGTRSLDMHVRRLRAKLRSVRDDPELAGARVPTIVAARAVGYRMTAPGEDRRTGQTQKRRIAPPAA